MGNPEVVIAATTETGFRRALELFDDRHVVVRFPVDLGGAVRRFLDAVRPDLAVMVELELWPNFVEEAARRDVPVAVVNGRLSARSFGRYHRVRALVPQVDRATLAIFDGLPRDVHCLVIAFPDEARKLPRPGDIGPFAHHEKVGVRAHRQRQ